MSEFLNLWFETVPAGAYGYSYQHPGQRFTNGAVETLDELVAAIAHEEDTGATGVWFRTTTLAEAPMSGRGTVDDTLAVPGVWADLDVAGPGHKHAGLPVDDDAAFEVIHRSGLPKPTAVLRTGGGLSAWWKYDEALLDIEQAAVISKHVHVLLTAGSPGVKIDNVSDLARVMRAPGTTNRKPGVDAPCTVLFCDGPTYAPTDIGGLPVPTRRVVAAPAPSLLDGPTRDHGTPRDFTLQAAKAYCRPALDKLARASNGEINVRLNEAAKVLSHFGPEFWKRATAEKWLHTALEHTDYDGASWLAEDTIRSAYASASKDWKAVPTKTVDPVVEMQFTDSGIAEVIVAEVLLGDFTYATGLGWMLYDGRRWARVDPGIPRESARRYVGRKIAALAREGLAGTAPFKGWLRFTNNSPLTKVIDLCASMEGVRKDATDFDADPDVLNTPDGVVDLSSGKVSPHDPSQLLTKITSGSYRRGYTHRDWDNALTALPEAERTWLQTRCGQAITGHTTDDGVIPLLYGPNGQNGKGALMTGGMLPAFADYAAPASTKLFEGVNAHPTEIADLRGQRLLMAEELTGNAVLNTDAIKRISDVESVKARFMRQDNFTFPTTHSPIMSSNHRPRVKATDGGTWRRLCIVVFPYEFVKPGTPLIADYQRRGDLGLKPRIKANTSGQHDAVVTWAVDGALRWYAWREASLRAAESELELPVSPMAPTARVEADTALWREENDYILAFWNNCLVADTTAVVASVDLLTHFNRWLTANGHPGDYSKERFAKEFSSHQRTREVNVVYGRTRNADAITRRPVAIGRGIDPARWIGEQTRQADTLADLGARPWTWSGVAYLRDQELQSGI